MDAMFKQKMENQAEWYGKNMCVERMDGWMKPNGNNERVWIMYNVYNRQIIIQIQQQQQRKQRSC